MKEKCTALIRFARTENKPWVDKLPSSTGVSLRLCSVNSRQRCFPRKHGGRAQRSHHLLIRPQLSYLAGPFLGRKGSKLSVSLFRFLAPMSKTRTQTKVQFSQTDTLTYVDVTGGKNRIQLHSLEQIVLLSIFYIHVYLRYSIFNIQSYI